MNIYIDESGSFADAPASSAWNCVGAYIIPEATRKSAVAVLNHLKRVSGVAAQDELKLRDVAEAAYFEFLGSLIELQGVLFAVCIDAGAQTRAQTEEHRDEQADLIVEHKERMRYPEGKQVLETLAAEIRGISPQLYVQLRCHAYLIEAILRRAVNYFALRNPRCLKQIRWRVDQKNAEVNVFETCYLRLCLPLLQSFSLTEPMIRIEGVDYSGFNNYVYPVGEEPTYLQQEYGFPAREAGSRPVNLTKLLTENHEFVDSEASWGVQLADLLSSGVRRCLRGGFQDNRRAAELLGKLMIQEAEGDPPILLVSFNRDGTDEVDLIAQEAVQTMRSSCRPMFP